MNKLLCKMLGVTALLMTSLVPMSHAGIVTVDFNDPSLAGLYFPGDIFTQNYFNMTPDFDFGIVDTAQALGNLAPSGNSTPFYFNSNDGGLILEQVENRNFALLGFDAAFVPLSPPSTQTTVIVAVGTHPDNSTSGVAWLFGAAVNGIYPFATYNNPVDFTSLTNLKSLEFFSCSLANNQLCTQATNNNGQFAVDNIRLSFVPEPASVALVLFGMLALGWSRQRKAG